jgi:ribosome maturation protein Sdo1
MAANDATGEADTSQYERQKAAEREAEEKVCPIASMCVEPEEGHIADPAILLTTRQAEVLAAALRNGPQEVEILALSGIIQSFTVEIAELVVQITQKYMDGMAYGLEMCVQVIDSSSKTEARCKLYIDDGELGEEGKKITLDWGIETCWGKEHDLARKKFWTFPYCHT